MAPQWWAGEPGVLHVWTREPHVDTPALCGEWAREWDTKPLDEHPLVEEGIIDSLRDFLNLYAVCDECRKEALRRYYPAEVEA